MNDGVEERNEEILVNRSLIPEAPPPYSSLVADDQESNNAYRALGLTVQHQQQTLTVGPAGQPGDNHPGSCHQQEQVPSHDPTRTDFFVHEEVKISLSRPDEADTSIDDCCAMCFVESMNCGVPEQSDAMIRWFKIGGRGLFYSFFSNNPSCCGLRIFTQLVLCLAAFVLLVLNLAILGIKMTSTANGTSSTMTGLLSVNLVLPFLLLVYCFIDLIIYIWFLKRKNRVCPKRDVVELYTVNAAYKANYARLFIPELILYPLTLSSLFAALFNGSFLFNDPHHVTNDSLAYPMTISFVLSGLLFFVMVIGYRLYLYVFLSYTLKTATRGTLPSKSIPGILGLFIYYSFGLTVLQVLITIYAARLGNDELHSFDWSVWYYMVYGCLCHMFGMFAVFLVNYRLIRGLCIELFFRVCSRIYHSIMLFPDNTPELTQFYARVLDRVRPSTGYSTTGFTLAHPFKNAMALITATLFGIASSCVLIRILSDEINVFSYMIVGVLCLVNIQTFLITLVVACVVALCVLLVVVCLCVLRYYTWRPCYAD